MTARDFELQLDREWLEAQADIADAVALIGLTAFQGVVQKSPVDTGRFKGNWNASIGARDATTTENVDPGGGEVIARASATLQGYTTTGDVFPEINITNGLPYSERLEDGYSGQAPAGMVGLTIAEIEARFDGYEV